jgi:hypothetical protein
MGKRSCADSGTAPTTDAEKDDTLAAINSVSASTGVDRRVILATIMQESGGCVRTKETSVGVRNPGLMQDHNVPNSCFTIPAPCPASIIHGMIMDGTAGTLAYPGGGDGLQQTLTQAANLGAPQCSAQQVYWASRIYNTGHYYPGTALEVGAPVTDDYVEKMANRLMGWVG